MSRAEIGVNVDFRNDYTSRRYGAEITADGNQGFRLVVPASSQPTTIALDDVAVLKMAKLIMDRMVAELGGNPEIVGQMVIGSTG